MNFRCLHEELEEQNLAAYAIKSSGTRGREVPEEPHPMRTEFQRDRDRIVYSNAFRRLEYKTQVFPNHEGDHFRTRLTHTIEVSNLSRSVARCLRLNEDFTECIALVHDIGHPPFGHCGQDILAKLMADHGGFEHNEQTYRLVTKLEKYYPNFEGLNLSIEIKEAILQHTRSYRKRYPDGQPALLETHLVSITDEMVYNAHDLDDGLSSGLLDEYQLNELEIIRRTRQKKDFPSIENNSLRRRYMVRQVLNEMVLDFLKTSKEKIDERVPAYPEEARVMAHEMLVFSDSMKAQKEELELFLKKNLYQHPKVRKMMSKSTYFMEKLFEHFIKYPDELPEAFQNRFESDGVHRSIADYIAGMTDRFIQEEYIRHFYPFQKML